MLRAALHRRFNCTNSVVLNEPLNDTTVVSAVFLLSFEGGAAAWQRKALLVSATPLLLVSSSLAAVSNASLARPDVPATLHATLAEEVPEGGPFLRLWSWGPLPPDPAAVLRRPTRDMRRVQLNRVRPAAGERAVVECYRFAFDS